MGNLENRSKNRTQKKLLQQSILSTVQAAGMLSVAALAPNALVAMKKLGLLPKVRQNEYLRNSALRLKERGLLQVQGGKYALTKEGEKILRRWEMVNHTFIRPKKWDKKWRMVIFDIPEKKRKIRQQVSVLFKEAGFYRLQDSVWVYPFDCEDVVGLLKTDYGIRKDVLYVIADEIENDKHLRDFFEIKT